MFTMRFSARGKVIVHDTNHSYLISHTIVIKRDTNHSYLISHTNYFIRIKSRRIYYDQSFPSYDRFMMRTGKSVKKFSVTSSENSLLQN